MRAEIIGVCFICLFVIRLFSGGVEVGQWTAKKVTYAYIGAGYVSFVDIETNKNVKIRGTFIVEEEK